MYRMINHFYDKKHLIIIFNDKGENREVGELLRLKFLWAIDWSALSEPHGA